MADSSTESGRLGRSSIRARLLSDKRGAALLEFAFAVPILIAFLIATAQLGIFLFARSGLKSAVAEGARYATIFPKPTNQQVADRINARRFGLDTTKVSAPVVTDCLVGTRPCINIEMSYTSSIDFIFFQTAPITVVESRRAFVQQCPVVAGVTVAGCVSGSS
jgi:Flp pilus assembly protein TadG